MDEHAVGAWPSQGSFADGGLDESLVVNEASPFEPAGMGTAAVIRNTLAAADIAASGAACCSRHVVYF